MKNNNIKWWCLAVLAVGAVIMGINNSPESPTVKPRAELDPKYAARHPELTYIGEFKVKNARHTDRPEEVLMTFQSLDERVMCQTIGHSKAAPMEIKKMRLDIFQEPQSATHFMLFFSDASGNETFRMFMVIDAVALLGE